MTNYHKLFLDSTYRAPPFQPAKPFFTLFNASNYWLQAALVIVVFIILNMMPFMRQAAHLAGGTTCPSLFGMLKDAFVCKEKVHEICNQTPKGHNIPPEGSNKEEESGRRYKVVREARDLPCPDDYKPREEKTEESKCDGKCKDASEYLDALPPAELRCDTQPPVPQAPPTRRRQQRLKNTRGARSRRSRSKARS